MDQFKTLYLSGFSSSVTINDIRSLLSKVSTVHDVYIPPTTATGIIRNFAMIKVENRENISKFVSSLNHSIWKGGKIRLELAREHYLDKLNREREESNQLSDSDAENNELAYNALEEYKPPQFADTKLFLVVSKNLQKYVTVGTEPSLGPSARFHRSKDKVARCHKIIFDEEGSINQVHSYPKYTRETEDAKENEKLDNFKSISKPTLPPTEYRGGGLRKGFGTLASASVADSGTSSSLKKAVELRVPATEAEEDETPCISAEELAADALSKERQRYATLLSQVLSKPTNELSSSSNNNRSILSFDDAAPQSKPQESAPSLEPGASFVNLGALKQIYHKEGGVWWGSDEKPTGAVGRGDEAEDEVFREAEKLGIDIRSSALGSGSGQEGIAGDGNGGKSGMLFGFFDSSEGDTGGALGNTLFSSSTEVGEEEAKFSMNWTQIATYARKFSRVGYVKMIMRIVFVCHNSFINFYFIQQISDNCDRRLATGS